MLFQLGWVRVPHITVCSGTRTWLSSGVAFRSKGACVCAIPACLWWCRFFSGGRGCMECPASRLEEGQALTFADVRLNPGPLSIKEPLLGPVECVFVSLRRASGGLFSSPWRVVVLCVLQLTLESLWDCFLFCWVRLLWCVSQVTQGKLF